MDDITGDEFPANGHPTHDLLHQGGSALSIIFVSSGPAFRPIDGGACTALVTTHTSGLEERVHASWELAKA